MRKRLFRRPSAAGVIAFVALFAALGGGAFAASDKTTDKRIANKAAKNYFNSHIGGASVSHATTANSANSATNATNATTASNAANLGGVPASGYTKNDCASLTGQIKGFALVAASGTFSSTLTTSGVFGYNCSGGTVSARRKTTGEYEVVFASNPAIIAVGSNNGSGTANPNIDTVSFNHPSGGDFEVGIFNDPTNVLIDDPFNMILP